MHIVRTESITYLKANPCCKYSLGLTNGRVQGEAAAPRLHHGRGRPLRPLHPFLHSLRRTPLKLLQKTVYLRLYTRRRVSHRLHRNTKNKHTHAAKRFFRLFI